MPDVVGTAHPPGGQSWRWEWQLLAACRGRSDLFFHPHGEREPMRSERERSAKRLCAGCPVRFECGEHALTMREPYGVWGGLSESERETRLYGQRPVRKR